MNLEYVIGKKGYGGLSKYAQCLYNCLKKQRGLEIDVTTPIVISGLPITLQKKSESDITHFTNQELISPLVTRNKKWIVTVHDLTVKKMDLFSKSQSHFKWLGSKLYDYKLSCLKNANHIITDSNNTKKDVIEMFGIDKKMITVIYAAHDLSCKPLKKIKKERNTLLYVGNELPHKNLPNLFKALAIAKKTIPDIRLIKIGSSGWSGAREELVQLAKELRIIDAITFKENVKDLAQEYNAAEALIFPSLSEGFGLPIVEAMACGCPVITSNRSSIPEIAGDAALYFNPDSAQDIANKIIDFFSEEKFKRQLTIAGLKRACLFSWEKCASETIKVYERVVKTRSNHS